MWPTESVSTLIWIISSLAHLGWMLVRCDVTGSCFQSLKSFSIFLLLVLCLHSNEFIFPASFNTLPYGCSFFASASFLLHYFPNLLSRHFLYLLSRIPYLISTPFKVDVVYVILGGSRTVFPKAHSTQTVCGLEWPWRQRSVIPRH